MKTPSVKSILAVCRHVSTGVSTIKLDSFQTLLGVGYPGSPQDAFQKFKSNPVKWLAEAPEAAAVAVLNALAVPTAPPP